jgi:hypothetical protein
MILGANRISIGGFNTENQGTGTDVAEKPGLWRFARWIDRTIAAAMRQSDRSTPRPAIMRAADVAMVKRRTCYGERTTVVVVVAGGGGT